MKKRLAILSILIAAGSLPSGICVAQTVVKSSAPPQKKEQSVKVVINENGNITEKEMTIAADSIYHSKDDGKKNKSVTVTVSADHVDGDKQHTYTYTVGDTLQNDLQKKVVWLNDNKRFIIMQNGDQAVIGESAPQHGTVVAGVAGVRMDPYAFDPSDPDIVSYKKKDKRNGLEQITIVRKKK